MSGVPRETIFARIEEWVVAENTRQNLVSAGSVGDFGVRHIEDSAQLAPLLNRGVLVDIGSGAGFPGLVLAAIQDTPVHLVEPRTKRARFLVDVTERLKFAHVVVHACKVERVRLPPVATITARAVASLDHVFTMAAHLSGPRTRWVLPKGRNVQSELAVARSAWQGEFELVPSRTDPDAAIVVASGVRRR